MKSLTILHPKLGHKEVAAVDIEKEFREIMVAGYGGNIPAVFIGEYPNGDVKKFKAEDAEDLIADPDVSVTVVGPLAGG